MTGELVEKSVEERLMKQRMCRRRPGDVLYPVELTNCSLNFDVWDQMFFANGCRGLTVHQFDKPPTVVLDLGCGGGYWAVEAAKQWKRSLVYGFDIKAIQPQLSRFPIFGDLARRVKWVHGNFLDGLPFPAEFFDFVRIVGIGLGVPEDEWQFVLEEVSRVLKPGGVLEIIEEDLIFPHARLLQPKPRPRPPPLTMDLPWSDSLPSSTTISDSSVSGTLLSATRLDPPDEFLETPSSSKSSQRSSDSQPVSDTLVNFKSPFSTRSSLILRTPSIPAMQSVPSMQRAPESDKVLHPQDHSRLAAAWDAMLSRRFLSPNLLAVLPFYLSSAFVDVQTHPIFKVPLPPNSAMPSSSAKCHKDLPPTPPVSPPSRSFGEQDSSSSEDGSSLPDDPEIYLEYVDPEKIFQMRPSHQQELFTSEASSMRSDPWECAPPQAPHWSSMHLARAVNIVKGSKDAIWCEYDVLYSGDFRPPVTRSARPGEARAKMTKPSSRENFDADWANWENDMADRIGMRGCVGAQLAWVEPPFDERPDWRIWRSNLESKAIKELNIRRDSDNEEDILCRSLRGWVAWKPTS
ncbi:hypothetical protein BDN72DRAFT_833810 [Pluteus cervinus]|uniref:Uncharacterized protein n=1 Tax=Pluteus cervinus TaxID=181527 RepID=A0ACD3B954_9AGAR|nr:hypothetical protein BDN72DRAFT_833810 [Pluteus cervinus]